MASKYVGKCSTSLVIGEMQIAATLRAHLTPVRTTVIKNTEENKFGQGYGEQGVLYTAMEVSMER